MRLIKLIRIASKAYYPNDPEILIRAHKGQDVGDTLAKFIVSELKSIHDKSKPAIGQIEEAAFAIHKAASQLNLVHAALYNSRTKEMKHGKVHSHHTVRKSRRCKRDSTGRAGRHGSRHRLGQAERV